MPENQHKAGFVNIIGRPNVGKSTLSNALVGERLSVITSKAQTTRHRILGILNEKDYQIIFSDTPGIIRKPQYKLHDQMNKFVRSAFTDADILLFMTELGESYTQEDDIILRLQKQTMPLLVLINKVDLMKETDILAATKNWEKLLPGKEIIPISALKGLKLEKLMQRLLTLLPVHPPYFPKDALTDKPERFFVSEIVREKILKNYHQEVPYSVQVVIENFQEEENIIRIRAIIYASRKSQKHILIGKRGASLKKVGTEARQDLEIFFDKKVYLELFVKIREDWRNRKSDLKRFGYE